MKYSESEIADLMEWQGEFELSSDAKGLYARKGCKELYTANQPAFLFTSWDFLKELEGKMIEELKIVRTESRFTADRSRLVIIYMKHHYHLSEIEVEGSGTTEKEAILNALIEYHKQFNSQR